MARKIQVGYGSDKRERGKRSNYASRNTGKVVHNGGFNFAPTVDFASIPEERWNKAFPNSYKPHWDK